MRVQFHAGRHDNGAERTGVQNVAAKSSGDVVLRYSDRKEHIDAEDHVGYSVYPER